MEPQRVELPSRPDAGTLANKEIALPTHRETVTTGIDMLGIVNGKIVEGWVTWDTLGLLKQLSGLNAEAEGGFLPLLERLQER